MKPLGIVRTMDDLGRVVVPKEIRRDIGVKEGDAMEIFATNKGIYLQKYNPDDETFPDIFKEMGCAAVPAQSPAEAVGRKKVIFHDYNNDQNYYFDLTASQINLLDWLIKEDFLDAKFEFMTDMDFVAP